MYTSYYNGMRVLNTALKQVPGTSWNIRCDSSLIYQLFVSWELTPPTKCIHTYMII